MSQIRSDILYNNKKKRVRESDIQIRRLHIATPIIEDNNETEYYNENETEELQTSDDNITVNEDNVEEDDNSNLILNDSFIEPYIKEQEQEWNTFIEEWIKAIEHENKFDYSEDEILLTDEMNNAFDFGGKNIHPADDETAKWSLLSLFVFDLKPPICLEADQIYSSFQ